MNWTFAQIVAARRRRSRRSSPETSSARDGGTGCFLELNGSKVTNDQWLRPGDVVSLTIDGLGTLANTIVEESDAMSLPRGRPRLPLRLERLGERARRRRAPAIPEHDYEKEQGGGGRR